MIFKPYIFCLLLTGVASSLQAQMLPDTLHTSTNGLNLQILQGPQVIGPNRVRFLMKDNARALETYNRSISTQQTRGLLIAFSALGLAYSAVTSASRNELVAGPGLAGIGCLTVALTLTSSLKKQKVKAVKLYNESVRLR